MKFPVQSRQPLILAYHGVCDEKQDGLALRAADFRRQMKWLKNRGYRSVTLADFIGQCYGERDRLAVITFDDGYRDNFTNAMPILQEFGFVATVFIVSDMMGATEPFWWDEPKIGSFSERSLFQAMSWKQVRQMADAGFEIGSHTCSHPDGFADLSERAVWDELTRSKQTIEQRLGRPVVSFSYPRGSVNGDTIGLVERAGYQCAVVTPSRVGIPRNRYALRRAGIYRENSDRVFRLKTSTVVGWLSEQTKRFKKPIPAVRPTTGAEPFRAKRGHA